MLQLTNESNLPASIVRAIQNDPYDKGDADISVTSLIDSPRIRVLKERYGDELEIDAVDRVWALLGQVGHSILERATTEGEISERRLFIDRLGWKVTGQVDLIEGKTLFDYKFTSAWNLAKGLRESWEQQLNLYRALCLANDIEVKALQIIAIARDWNVRYTKKPGYPEAPVLALDVPVWPLAETHRYLDDRILLHQFADEQLDDELPLCSAKEQWKSDDVWAIQPMGGDRAIRNGLFTGGEEAMTRLVELNQKPTKQTLVISHRPGKAIRCHHHCDVASVCSQAREFLEDPLF